jgi:hypothetical protein
MHVYIYFFLDGRVFLTFLGMNGVPATLATVTDRNGPSGPLVKPYPDWSWFKKGDCDSLTSIYRIAVKISIHWKESIQNRF